MSCSSESQVNACCVLNNYIININIIFFSHRVHKCIILPYYRVAQNSFSDLYINNRVYIDKYRRSFFLSQDKHAVLILFKSKKTERNPVSVKVDGRRINAKYLNPYTYSFLPTGRFTDRQKVMRSKSCFLILFFFLNLLWKMLIFFGNSKKITLFLIAITTFTGGRFSRIICSEFESEEQEYWE